MEAIITVLLIILAVGFLSYLFKTVLKIAIFIIAAIIIFNIAFIYTGQDIKNLNLEKYVGESAGKKIEEVYEKFTQKREETKVMEAEKFKKAVEEKVKEKIDTVVDGVVKEVTSKAAVTIQEGLKIN